MTMLSTVAMPTPWGLKAVSRVLIVKQFSLAITNLDQEALITGGIVDQAQRQAKLRGLRIPVFGSIQKCYHGKY